MSIDLLPLDIFNPIAAQLTSNDHLNCALVCHAWHAQFRHWLFRYLTVGSRRNFGRVFKLLRNSLKSSQPLGPFVQTIKIKRGSISEDELHHLRALCPNVDSLRIEAIARRVSHAASPSIVSHNSLVFSFFHAFGQSLTHLTVDNASLHTGYTEIESLSMLTLMPHLKSLCLSKMMLRMDELEFIQVTCPSLEQLSIEGDSLIVDPVHKASLPSDSATLRSLCLRYCCGWLNYAAWIQYVSHAYPNVETLDFQCTFYGIVLGRENAEMDAQRMEAFDFLGKRCKRLSVLRFSDIKLDHRLFQILARHDINLSEISVLNSYPYRALGQQEMLNSIVRYTQQARNVQTLSASIFPYTSFSSSMTMRLVRLTIHDVVNIDSLQLVLRFLDNCQELEELTIVSSYLPEINAPPQTNPVHKRLVRLTVQEVTLSSSSLSYLCNLCPNLRHLSLIACSFLSVRQKCAPKIMLQIPNHLLSSISLQSLVNIDGETIRHGMDRYRRIKLFALMRDQQISGRSIFDATVPNPVQWYHMNEYTTANGRCLDSSVISTLLGKEKRDIAKNITRLSRAEIDILQRKSTEDPNSRKRQRASGRGKSATTALVNSSWKLDDIFRGFIAIQCKSIERFIINGYEVHINETYPN